ncbi:hypothetical protein TrRE_jg11427 [Triparma retinervis]|uniref:Phosphoglycerate mutase n=1 Tax=Triparma retinervis TaxID=2557542 RepID=A0A9W6ZDH3_9STRA|nr:hypothetical protein TrRE_jg11427 [Triparma retinervis]
MINRFPKRIILCRHGESKGNVSDKAYVTTPDWLIPLSATGLAQSAQLGTRLSNLLSGEPCYFYTSPYLRTKQTLARVLQKMGDGQTVGVREEPRLTEQQFGNFQNVDSIRSQKSMRHNYGRFYYRFPEGESGLDVYNRCSSFVNTLRRDFQDRDVLPCPSLGNVCLVTHGLTMRLLCMRLFQYSVTDFERTVNARNCGVIVLERRDDVVGRAEGEGRAVSITQAFAITRESRDLVGLPKEGRVRPRELIKEVLGEEGRGREGLGSMSEPGEHIKYWTDKRLGGGNKAPF